MSDLSRPVLVDMLGEEEDEDGRLLSPYEERETAETGAMRAIFKSSKNKKTTVNILEKKMGNEHNLWEMKKKYLQLEKKIMISICCK